MKSVRHSIEIPGQAHLLQVHNQNPNPAREKKDPYTWYEDDIPTADLMEKYLANVSALRSTIDLLSTTPEAPESMELLTYIEANNIEHDTNRYSVDYRQVVQSLQAVQCVHLGVGTPFAQCGDRNLWEDME